MNTMRIICTVYPPFISSSAKTNNQLYVRLLEQDQLQWERLLLFISGDLCLIFSIPCTQNVP